MFDTGFTRRDAIRAAVGLPAVALPVLPIPAVQASSRATRARSCIVIYLWGGIAHQESWDPKPEAASELRGEF